MNVGEFFKRLRTDNAIQIIQLIGEKEVCVGDLVKALRQDQSLVSHHLIKMKRMGMLKSRVDGQKRLYSIPDKRIPKLLADVEAVCKHKI